MSCGRGGTIRELLSEIADLRAAERRVIALLSDERQANADLRAALAQSEASQRALRTGMQREIDVCQECDDGTMGSFPCVFCGPLRRLLAAPPPAAAQGAETTE